MNEDWWKEAGKEFFETIKGIPQILKSKSCAKRWFYGIVFGFLVCVFGVNMAFLIADYYYYYQKFTTYGEAEQPSQFPDITICNAFPFNNVSDNQLTWKKYHEFLDEQERILNETLYHSLNISRDRYNATLHLMRSRAIYFANLEFNRTADKVSSACSNFVVDFAYYECPFVTGFSRILKSWRKNFKTFWNADYYQCYTHSLNTDHGPYLNQMSAILYINNFPTEMHDYFLDSPDQIHTGVHVVIHAPGTKADLSNGYSIGPGTETTIRILITSRTRLEPPVGDFPCDIKPNNTHSYKTCIDFCMQELIKNRCHCVSPFLGVEETWLNFYSMCGNQSEEIKRGDFSSRTALDQLVCISGIDPSEKVNCERRCSLPCSENTYDGTVSSAPWPHIAYHLSFYNKYVNQCSEVYGKKFDAYRDISATAKNESDEEVLKKLKKLDLIEENFLKINFMIKKYKPDSLVDKPLHSLATMVPQIGACFSMWLGISVWTVVELVKYIVTLIHLKVRNDRSTTNLLPASPEVRGNGLDDSTHFDGGTGEQPAYLNGSF